jgi:hypothetical protein
LDYLQALDQEEPGDLDHFVHFRPDGLDLYDVIGIKHRSLIGDYIQTGVVFDEFAKLAIQNSAFFQAFSSRRFFQGFPFIRGAARNLPGQVVKKEAVLPDQKHFLSPHHK